MKNAENQNREIEKTPCTNNVHEEICRSENKKTADCVDFWRFSEIPHKHWVFPLCTNNVHKPVQIVIILARYAKCIHFAPLVRGFPPKTLRSVRNSS